MMQVIERKGLYNWLAKFNIAKTKQVEEGLMDRFGGVFLGFFLTANSRDRSLSSFKTWPAKSKSDKIFI